MLSQKIKKVVSVLLIASMTFTSAGFSVLANSVDDVVQNIEGSESQKEIKNYYLEYKQYEERTVIVTTKNSDDGSNANGDNAGSVDNKNQIANSNGENEAPSINSAEEDEGDTTKNKNYAEEPEEAEKKSSDAEEKTDKENSENENANSENEKSEKENSGNDNADAEKTGNNSENEGSNNEATEKSQSSDEEKNNDETNNETNKIDNEETTTEVESTIEETTTVESTTVESTTEETTTEETTSEEASTEQTTETTTTEVVNEEENKKEKVDVPEESTESQVTINNDELNNVDDIKNNKSNINFVDATDSETSKEVVVVKKYIYATRSIPEDSVWTLKEILANDASASFKTIPNTETIKEKYLAKNIKVLLVNQYGDEKVVEVPATWNVEFYSKVYFPEGYVPIEKDYETDAEGNLTITDKEGNVEVKKASESDIENINIVETDNDTDEDIDDSDIDEVKGFAGTEEEFGGNDNNGNTGNPDNKDNDKNNENTADDHDVVIDDKEVIVEYEEVTDDSPIKVDDEDLTKGNVLLGNANTNIVSKESAKEEAAAILNMEELLKALAGELGTQIKTDGIITPYAVPIFGATPTGHAHWVCGRANCSDTIRNHFNENMDTKHSYTGSHDYQAISNQTQLEEALARGDGDSDYDFLYLTGDIEINKMIKVYRQLFICLN